MRAMWERALALLGLAEEEDEEETRTAAGQPAPRLTVLARHGQAGSRSGPLRITLRRPGAFEQARELAERLRAGEAVILDLNACEREVARRILDFLTGVLWAVDGEVHRVGEGIVLLAPGGVAVGAEEEGGA